eukprot:TsM_000198100 transcript=TsM_000198100 gene=TsM_000198100
MNYLTNHITLNALTTLPATPVRCGGSGGGPAGEEGTGVGADHPAGLRHRGVMSVRCSLSLPFCLFLRQHLFMLYPQSLMEAEGKLMAFHL